MRTLLLMASLSGLFLFCGYLIGGQSGIVIALGISLVMNLQAYFFSDKYVLKSSNAQPLSEERFPHIHRMVEELAAEYEIPKPKLWIVPTPVANAFATGRNPKNGHVAVTEGILQILDERELRGVLAHELGHVKNYDILVSSMAATIAGAIGMLANTARWSAYSSGNRSQGGQAGALLIALVMPVAAALLHMGISRSREYMADSSGAHACKDPLALASALQKLDASVKREHPVAATPAQAAVASLYIVYPFSTKSLSTLFSTHPPMEERIRRLREMARG
ncbi:MAG: zinc metalloprotease HtpX [Chlamydiia bacterium]|nr:zinc metalloprotease HtpX [Chlamydiia bacterium]